VKKEADRIALPSGISHLPEAIRLALRKANEAGLEGHAIADIDIGLDLAMVQECLNRTGALLIAQRILISYKAQSANGTKPQPSANPEKSAKTKDNV
jgi:hypothetical protein